jgi:hypothetical protein
MCGGATEPVTQLISEITLVILVLAAVVFVFKRVRQRRVGQLSTSSFSTVLLAMIVGWIATEVVGDVSGVLLGDMGRVGHFLVMALFAVTMTWQFRRSFRE